MRKDVAAHHKQHLRHGRARSLPTSTLVAEMGDYLSSSCKLFRLAQDKIILTFRLPENNPDNENEDYLILRIILKIILDYPKIILRFPTLISLYGQHHECSTSLHFREEISVLRNS